MRRLLVLLCALLAGSATQIGVSPATFASNAIASATEVVHLVVATEPPLGLPESGCTPDRDAHCRAVFDNPRSFSICNATNLTWWGATTRGCATFVCSADDQHIYSQCMTGPPIGPPTSSFVYTYTSNSSAAAHTLTRASSTESPALPGHIVWATLAAQQAPLFLLAGNCIVYFSATAGGEFRVGIYQSPVSIAIGLDAAGTTNLTLSNQLVNTTAPCAHTVQCGGSTVSCLTY